MPINLFDIKILIIILIILLLLGVWTLGKIVIYIVDEIFNCLWTILCFSWTIICFIARMYMAFLEFIAVHIIGVENVRLFWVALIIVNFLWFLLELKP